MEGIHERICSVSHGGISILNGIPTGYGAAVAVNLEAKSCITENYAGNSGSALVDAVLEYFHKSAGTKHGAQISSSIPASMGLKSSSAVSVSLIACLQKATGISGYPPRLSAIISRQAGLSVTGAFDDAVAAYQGGSFLTNNTSMVIEQWIDFDPDTVFVLLLKGKRETRNPEILRNHSSEFMEALRLVRSGDVTGAMNLNGRLVAEYLGYGREPVMAAERCGAIASGVTGNGPAVFGLFRKGEEGPLIDEFTRMGTTMVVRPVMYDCTD
ncbi:MAG: shikimate kinase [Thermoplasmataceae archaeon]